MPYLIWWSRALNNISKIVKACNEEDKNQYFQHIVSAYRSSLSLHNLEGSTLREPKKLSSSEYLQFSLEHCRKRKVALFIPYWYRSLISEQRSTFAELGTQVLVAGTPKTLNLLSNKRLFYEDLAKTNLPLPPWRSYRCAATFKQALEQMPTGEAGYCLKPAISIFGRGFARLKSTSNSFQDGELNKQKAISIQGYIKSLNRSHSKEEMLLMAYLPGLERSIDCLAHQGKLVRAISRLKISHTAQYLETEGVAIDLAKQLVERYNLSGIINIQTRDDAYRQPRILEINARISGGIHYTFPSGVILPYWAIALALGLCSPDDVPYPRSLTVFKNGQEDSQRKKGLLHE